MTNVASFVPAPSPAVDPYTICAQIDSWLPHTVDVPLLHDTKAKLSAIDQYLDQTARQGRAAVTATMRRLEVRIGEVIGATKPGARHDLQPSIATEGSLSKDERSQFREMAEHADVVEAVIAESTDEEPASRRKVLGAIKDEKAKNSEAPVSSGLDRTRDGVEQRIARARELAARGHTSQQIAIKLGMSPAAMSMFRQRHGVAVPADAIVGRRRSIDSTRIVKSTVDAVDGIGLMFEHIDYADLDLSDVDHWTSTLSQAIRSLTTLRNRLKELNQ